jgi:DNA-directed RNA polymerase sigma subunit (sigma70/sigma32)
LKYHVRARFSEVAGKRSSKYQHTISLDEPLTDDTDMTRLDMIVDESATDAFDDVTENVYISQLHETLEQCLSTLPEVQADTLRARYYDKRTVSAIASMKDVDMAVVRRHEIRALGALRLGKSAALLAEYRDDIVSKSIRFCTFASFDHTGYSSTEWATERLLDYEKRLF